ncbi:MAG TPA: hypothetical protein PLK99_12715, partial [Burkholderiales bacterium]|nr:hypothetical protein [Burkholderiales bacterium]
IRTVTDNLILVENGMIVPFEGDIEDYGRRVLQDSVERKPDKGNRKRIEAEIRARRRPIQLKIEKIEEEMEKLNAETKAIENKIADPAFYAERDAVKSALLRQAGIRSRLAELEDEWFELNCALEALA